VTSSVGKFLGNTVGEAAAFAAGVAISPVLHPVVQSLANEAWAVDPTKPLDATLIAEAVAHGHIDAADGRAEALLTGCSNARFDELVKASLTGPGVQSAFELWRRNRIEPGQFDGALQKAGIEPEWIALVHDLKDVWLDPAIIAVAVQRGLLPNEGILPVGPPTVEGKVPPMPVVGLDPFVEAAGSGVNPDRLKVLTRIVGLPASPDLAARMVFRGIIEPADFDRAIAEGNTRNEWAPFLFDGFREILTAHDYIEARLRAWIDTQQMHDGTAKHGMSDTDADLLLKISGRPLSFHQSFIGARRGGTYDGDFSAIPPYFLKSLQESNIRPEWYALAWAQRYVYPTAFVLRALTEAGDLTETETHDILLYEGWEPTLAAKVANKWATTTTAAKADPWVTKAEGQLWTATHKAYTKGGITKAEASTAIEHFLTDAATITRVFVMWDAEVTVLTTPPPPVVP
jgi:hypothetical protein